MTSNNSHLDTFTFYSGIIPDTENFSDLQDAAYSAISRIQSEFISGDPRTTKIPVLTLSGFTVTIPASSAVSATGISTYWDEAVSILATTATKGSLQGSIAPIASRKRYAVITVFNEDNLTDLQTNDIGGSSYYNVGSASNLYVYQTASDVILSDDYTLNTELLALLETIRSDDDGVVLAICEIINGATGLLTQDVHPAQMVMFPAGGPNSEVDEVREFFGHSTLATVLSDSGTVSAVAFVVSGTPGNIAVAGGETIMLTVPALGANSEFREVRTIKAILPAATFTFALNNESYIIRAKWNDDLKGLEVYLGTGDYPNDPNSLPFAVGTSGGTNLGYRRTLMDLPILSIATGSDGTLPVISHIANNALAELNYILPIVDNIVVHETDDVQLTNDYSVENRNFTFPNDLDGFLTELTAALNPVLKSGDSVSTMSQAYANIDSGLLTSDSLVHVSGTGALAIGDDAWSVDIATAGYGTPTSSCSDGRNFYVAFDDNTVRSLDGDTGSVLWTSSTIPAAISYLASDGENVFAYSTAGTLYRLDGSDGSEIGTLAVASISGGLVTDGTHIYFGIPNGIVSKYLVDLSGADLWSVAASSGMVLNNLCINGKHLAASSDYDSGTLSNLTVFNLSDGSIHARSKVGSGNTDQYGCVFTNNTLLVAGDAGLLSISINHAAVGTLSHAEIDLLGDGTSLNYRKLSCNNKFGAVTNDGVSATVFFFSINSISINPWRSDVASRSGAYTETQVLWDKVFIMGEESTTNEDILVVQLPIFPATFRVTATTDKYRYPIVGKLFTSN